MKPSIELIKLIRYFVRKKDCTFYRPKNWKKLQAEANQFDILLQDEKDWHTAISYQLEEPEEGRWLSGEEFLAKWDNDKAERSAK